MNARPTLTTSIILGLGQILTWGGSFFLMAVLAAPVVSDTGWPRQWVYGSLSLGMLVAGLLSPRVGRGIGRNGGRRLLAGSGLLIAAGLVLLASAPVLAVFVAGWLVIGAGMAIGLYDPLFATLGALYGDGARRSISYVTLVSGFCTTLVWPLMGWLIASLGWREACLSYAALLVRTVWPLHMYALPDASPMVRAVSDGPPQDAGAEPPATLFWLVTAGFIVSSVVMTAVSVQLIALLQASGFTLAAALGIGSLIGPAQVGARLVDAAAMKLHPFWSALGFTLLVAAGLLLLVLAPAMASVAIVLYGAGSGIRSIVRGTLPLALFGRRHYATVLGRIAQPVLIAQAATPLLGGYVLEHAGAKATLVALAVMAMLNIGLVLALLPWRRPGNSAAAASIKS